MSAKVIGLLGGTGAGKSTAAAWLAGRGCVVIDADDVSRDIMQRGHAGYRAAVDEFGTEILDVDGEIDRRRLGRRVFGDAQERLRLERAVHPLMADEIRRQIDAAGSAVVVLDCAVLLRPIFRTLVDEVWMVDAPLSARLERIIARDELSESDARARACAQQTEDEMRAAADRVIQNAGSATDLYAQLESALR